MLNGNSQDLRNVSMFDLFRLEVETHTAVINEGLLTLRKDPTTGEHLDDLIRAAHSIKGGARIVDLAVVADIAGMMEKCFSALQKGDSMLSAGASDTLGQALNTLKEIGQVTDEALPEWLDAHHDRLSDLIAALSDVLSPNVIGIAKSGLSTPSKTAHKAESVSVSQSAEAAPTAGATPPAGHITIDFSGGIMDESMLELFRSEVETHAAALTEGLLRLEENPGATDQLEALMRAAHSIKGGARVVELDAVVQIAHIMEDCFVAAQKNKLSLSSDHIDILLTGVDMLTRIGQITGQGAAEWLADHQEEILELTIAIALILDEKTSVSVSLRKEGQTSSAPQSASISSSIPVTQEQSVKQHVTPVASTRPTQVVKSLDDAEASLVPDREKQPPVSSAEERDRMIRVTATKIERLMGLGGEVVVSARWLPQFSESLINLKKSHNELFMLLEKIQELLGDSEQNRQVRSLVFQGRERTRECSLALADRLNQLDLFTSTSANLSDRLYHEVIGVRMRPFADGVRRFPRMVRDLAKQLGKKVKLEILGKSTDIDRDILEKLDAPLTHLLRNAIDHGIEFPEERVAAGKPAIGLLRLEAVHRAGMLMITFSDDGRGIDLDKLRRKILDKGMASAAIVEDLTEIELMEFLFLPGFSTSDEITEISGRGVGLDVVHDMVHEVGGVIRAMSTPEKGVSFHLELPLTLSVIRTFLVEIAGEPYAFPLARIDRCLVVPEDDLETVEDRQYFRFDNTNIALVDVHDILEIEESASHDNGLPVVVISDRSHAYAVLVDKFIGECDLVVRPIDPRLGKVPDFSAVAVMLDGSPVLIFDVDDMLRSVDKMVNVKRLRKVREALTEGAGPEQVKRILVVDDSITVREMERKILENQGYHVEVAVDGMDGWNAVRTEQFDLVVTDIDMPRLNGIELVTNIKQHDDLKSLPVIIISYKDTEAHRLQGLEAGANYYLTKSSFQDDSFVNAVVDLIGEV